MHFSFALTVMGAFCGVCAFCGAATRPEAQYVDAASGTDWPGFGRTYGEQHFSPLNQIDSHNVGRLGLAWYIDLPPGNAATEPVEVGGVLYYAQGLSVIHAVDAASGKELWRYDPQAGEQAGLGLRFSCILARRVGGRKDIRLMAGALALPSIVITVPAFV